MAVYGNSGRIDISFHVGEVHGLLKARTTRLSLIAAPAYKPVMLYRASATEQSQWIQVPSR